nr:hypothetical protein [Tanacetum cinerariifolium]
MYPLVVVLVPYVCDIHDTSHPRLSFLTDPVWGCDRLVSRAQVIENQDSSYESVGSSPSRIILFGTIPAEIPSETPTIPPVVPILPHTLSFLCFDSSETSSDSFKRPPSQDPYEVTVARWRSRVVARSSPTHDLPPTDVTPPTLPRKRVRALLVDRLASRYPPDHSSSDHFASYDSLSDLSSNSSLDYSSDSSSGHSLPDSSFDAPATISARPSRKRCRSPAASVPLATLVPGALSPEAYTKPDIDFDVQAYIDANTAATETASALEFGIRIEADVGVKVGIGIEREYEVEEEAKSRDKGTIEIGFDRVLDIESAQKEQGRMILAASEQRAGMLDRIGVLERDNMRLRGMLCVKRDRVDSLRRHMSYTQEELRHIRVSRYYDRADFKRLETFAMRRLGYRP